MDAEGLSDRPVKRAKLSLSSTENQAGLGDGIEIAVNEIVIDSKEIDVGITAFVTHDIRPFKAVLKTRYTDFLVNEILPDGSVVHLRSTAVPSKFCTKSVKQKDYPKSGESIEPVPGAKDEIKDDASSVGGDTNNDLKPEDQSRISENDKQKLVAYLNDRVVSEILSLYQAILKNPGKKPKDHFIVRTEFTNDRSRRAEIHGFIRQLFHSRIESSTDKEGTLVLTAANPNPRGNQNQSDQKSSWRPGKLGWAERGGEFLHFTLYKENRDTMEAISWLTRQMKVNAKVFQFAGTKDRRAVTAQRVSAYRMDMERLAGQNRSLRGSSVGDFEYQLQGLELGDLTGNEFVITLRECQFSNLSEQSNEQGMERERQMLQTAMNNLRNHGYLNYYGLQRFGTFATRTDEVGLHILQGDFQAATDAILRYDPNIILGHDQGTGPDQNNINRKDMSDDAARAKALSIFKTESNMHKALEVLPRKFSAEISLIRHLNKQRKDYVGALMNIPRNLRLMYVHAYQSLVWNHAVTNRMQKYGSNVVEGDLVLIHEHRDKNEHFSTSASTTNATANDVDADGEIIIVPAQNDRANNPEDAFERARHLTAEEAASGKYTIFDIVLPLPGYDVLYPDHETGAFYKLFMAEHGGLDPMDMRRKQRDFSLSGSYRKILGRIGPGWEILDVRTYHGDEEQFVQTDMDILKQSQQSQQSQQEKAEEVRITTTTQTGLSKNTGEQTPNQLPLSGKSDKQEEKQDVPQSPKIAVVLKFQLGSSQYATMALRELSHGGITAYKPEFSGKR